jgi:DmsE family decaheme c-type cytochrome
MPAVSLLRQPGSALCVGCHPQIRGSFAKPYTHPMHESVDGAGRAGMQCASCHNPHGGRGEDSLKRDRTGDVACMSCHTEKRGPFVYTHPATVAGSCRSCHEPHGSVNAMMLTRSRVSQLCLECHTGVPAGTVGSQPPSLHDLHSPRYQNCTSCHIAIHGSNSSPLLAR